MNLEVRKNYRIDEEMAKRIQKLIEKLKKEKPYENIKESNVVRMLLHEALKKRGF